MSKIQKLIKELEQLKSNAKKDGLRFFGKDEKKTCRYIGKMQAFDLCIRKLTLLLNTGNEKQR